MWGDQKIKGIILAYCVLALGTLSFFPSMSVAHKLDEAGLQEEVLVWGKYLSLSGTALTASEGRIGHTDFSNRSLLRVGELIEVVPAMIATQHSGAGKANQYFLRGFNLDHGTDFAGFFDGVPTNMPTHGHGQGYLDFNFIIPETIESIAYYKGPYHTKIGNFSSAGSVQFKTYDRLERGIAQAAIGQGNYFRALLVNSQLFLMETFFMLLRVNIMMVRGDLMRTWRKRTFLLNTQGILAISIPGLLGWLTMPSGMQRIRFHSVQ